MRIDPIPRFQIPPRSTVRKAVKINAESRVTPGVYPAQFEVSAYWNWVGKPEERHLIVTKTATLGVFFESELLKALSIPSFLVLPGCLVIFTMQMLLAFNVLGAKNESKLPDLGVTTSSFWILSITYSGIYAVLYIALMKNNYLLRYGLEDLVRVWLSSILIGVVLYLLIAGITQKRRRERVPTATDDEVTVLRKMSRNGLGLVVPEVRFTLNNIAWRGFAIEPIKDGNTLLWVAPPIATEWGANPAAVAAETAHNADLTMALNPAAADARDVIALRVADRLHEASSNNLVEVRWDPQGGPAAAIAGPMHIKTEAITSYMAPGRIIT